MKGYITGFLLLVALASRASSYEADRFYFAIRTEKPPVIDGRLDDECWKNAAWQDGFVSYYGVYTIEAQTHFAMLFDDRTLYVAVRSEKPLVESTFVIDREKEGWPTKEAIEIFLDPNQTYDTYYQLAAGMEGPLYDAKVKSSEWNSGWKAASSGGKGEWFLEAAIPVEAMGIERLREGDLWGLNICRNRTYPEGGAELSSWSETHGGFHAPWNFGNLVMGSAEELFSRKYLPEAKRSIEEITAALQDIPALRGEFSGRLDRCRSLYSLLSKEVARGVARDSFDALNIRGQELLEECRAMQMEIRVIRADLDSPQVSIR